MVRGDYAEPMFGSVQNDGSPKRCCCCRCRTFCIFLCILLLLFGGAGYYVYDTYYSHNNNNSNSNKCFSLLSCDDTINGTDHKTCQILTDPSEGYYQILNGESKEIDVNLLSNYSIKKMRIKNIASAVSGDDNTISIKLYYWDYEINNWNNNVTIISPLNKEGILWYIYPLFNKYQINNTTNINGTMISDTFKLKVINNQLEYHVDLSEWWIWGQSMDDIDCLNQTLN